ncbi:uncharacterized protein LOC143044606 [Mytilus galloprovincialis]|uniref:uncharacterized protein LOC143044606 n=1 Tax=Mytilus galloprovincialis TaxID=29158 RepID=UPI003F7BD079
MFLIFTILSLLLPTGSSNTLDDSKLLGLGYDLLRANPEGGRFSTSGLDPGIKPTRQILQIDDTNRNFLIRVDNVTFCTNHTTYEYFSDAKTKQEYLLRDYITSGDGDMLIRPYAFMAGSVFHRASIPNRITVDQITICNQGRSRYVMPPVYPSLHKLNDEFIAAACSLPTSYDPTVYSNFIKDWGTHSIVEVETGTKTVSRYEIPATKVVEEMFKKYTDPPIWKVVMVKGDGSMAYVNTSHLADSNLQPLTTGVTPKQFNVGRMGIHEPLEFHLVSIARFLDGDFWPNENQQQWDSSCQNYNMHRNLSTTKQNLLRALNEYPSSYHLTSMPSETTHTLTVPLIWPTGTFSLYQPVSGCPNSHIMFETGWRFHDNEDTTQNNSWSIGHHLAGDTHNRIDSKFYFCTQVSSILGVYHRNWPVGNYCILKYGTCPLGFNEGSINWDDEDAGNNKGGTLPSGTYQASDTIIFYCCRSDGHNANKMFLPLDKPFYLLKFTGDCQQVYGMRVQEEFFQFDDQNSNNHGSCHGAHPYDTGCDKDQNLHFCYYEADHQNSVIFG